MSRRLGSWGAEDFQLVAFREAVAAQEVEVVRVAGDDVRDVHGLLFVAVVGGGLLRLGEVEARAVGAVETARSSSATSSGGSPSSTRR